MKKFITILCLAAILFTFASCSSTQSNNGNNGSGNDNNNSGNNNSSFFKETEPPVFWVNFETNGGSYVDSQLTLLLKNAPETTKEDHVFMGWYLDEQLTEAAVFPMEITFARTLYAKWLRVKNQSICKDVVLKNWEGNYPSVDFPISPNGFDMDELAKQGYKMNITVNYTVYYRKAYDVPLDIGYMGAPNYSVFLHNSQHMGVSHSDRRASKSSENKQLTLTGNITDIKNTSWTLNFSTENIQNKVYFENITVTYECYK